MVSVSVSVVSEHRGSYSFARPGVRYSLGGVEVVQIRGIDGYCRICVRFGGAPPRFESDREPVEPSHSEASPGNFQELGDELRADVCRQKICPREGNRQSGDDPFQHLVVDRQGEQL